MLQCVARITYTPPGYNWVQSINANMNAQCIQREVAFFQLLPSRAINYFAHCAIFQLVVVALFKLCSTTHTHTHTHRETHTQTRHFPKIVNKNRTQMIGREIEKQRDGNTETARHLLCLQLCCYFYCYSVVVVGFVTALGCICRRSRHCPHLNKYLHNIWMLSHFHLLKCKLRSNETHALPQNQAFCLLSDLFI